LGQKTASGLHADAALERIRDTPGLSRAVAKIIIKALA
jgi:hypothetical protein